MRRILKTGLAAAVAAIAVAGWAQAADQKEKAEHGRKHEHMSGKKEHRAEMHKRHAGEMKQRGRHGEKHQHGEKQPGEKQQGEKQQGEKQQGEEHKH